MMIGFSLVVEGFGFHIPKGYLYAAIGFSILVEMINQTMRRNQEKASDDYRFTLSHSFCGFTYVRQ